MLSDKEYRLRLGLPAAPVSSADILKNLEDLIGASIGKSSDALVVEVLGTVETQDLHFRVSPKVFEEIV